MSGEIYLREICRCGLFGDICKILPEKKIPLARTLLYILIFQQQNSI